MIRPRHGTRRVLRSVLVLVLVLVGAVAVGGTASAHTGLSSSDPADGAVLTAPPATVTLVFDAPMVDIGATVVITGPDGQQYPTGTRSSTAPTSELMSPPWDQPASTR